MADDPLVMPRDEFELVRALDRVRAMAVRWSEIEGDELDAEVSRRLSLMILGMLHAFAESPGGAVERLAAVRALAEGWMKPGGPGLFAPAAGQCVLDAIRGGSTEAEASWRERAEWAEAKLAEAEAKLAGIADYIRDRARPASQVPPSGSQYVVVSGDVLDIIGGGVVPLTAVCTGPDCGTRFMDSETGEYLFATRERMERLLHADGWQADPVLCPACQDEEGP